MLSDISRDTAPDRCARCDTPLAPGAAARAHHEAGAGHQAAAAIYGRRQLALAQAAATASTACGVVFRTGADRDGLPAVEADHYLLGHDHHRLGYVSFDGTRFEAYGLAGSVLAAFPTLDAAGAFLRGLAR
jgi:hypothetical protein